MTMNARIAVALLLGEGASPWSTIQVGAYIHDLVYAGGSWRFVMHGPDGRDSPKEGVFLEVTPPGA